MAERKSQSLQDLPNEEQKRLRGQFLVCYELVEEVEDILREPERLREYFDQFSTRLTEAVSQQQPDARAMLHLARGLMVGGLSCQEKLEDKDMPETKTRLPELPKYLDGFIEILKKGELTTESRFHFEQEEQNGKLRLVFGLIVAGSPDKSDDWKLKVYEKTEGLSHYLSGKEFVRVFSVYELLSDELGRRIYNK